MGTRCTELAFHRVAREDAQALADTLLGWLIEHGIVLPEKTDCALGQSGGYPPGPHAETAIDGAAYLDRLRYNGLEITVGPKLCISPADFDDALAFACATCGSHTGGSDFFERRMVPAIETFLADEAEPLIACPTCERKHGLRSYEFTPPALAAAYCTLTFWEWFPVKNEFIAKLAAAARGKPTVLAYKF